MGSIFIQPSFPKFEEVETSSLVVYTHRISAPDLLGAVEWAAGSQSPIFCHEKDIQKLVDRGFGAYRFNGISGYREVGFQGGTLEFYPGRRRKASRLKSLFVDFLELYGYVAAPAYHLLFRPRDEKPVLFLCSSRIDAIEWKVLTRAKPSIIIGSAEAPDEDWESLGRLYGANIVRARLASEIKTEALEPADDSLEERTQPWPEIASSFS